MTFTCQAILFDLDGVLADSTLAVERVWRRWAAESKLDPELVMEHAHGRRTIETIRIVAPELDAEEETRKVEEMEIADKEGIIAIPGAPELLRNLPSERFAVVTSATRALAKARLQFAGLFVPANLVGADDVIEGKPSPEPYLKGAALLGFAPADCIVFEDTPAGIESARAAGMRVIALNTTYPEKELRAANAILDSLADAKANFQNGVVSLEILPRSSSRN
ncbi:MAG TPA: HAD family hydrolase [Candidatus Angelobacter sp.]